MKALLLAVIPLFAMPVVAAPMLEQLRPVGQGEMRWLWVKLYDATLYSADGRYRADARPLALSLRYARDIEREDLLTATREEWQRLGNVPAARREMWLAQLSAIWPDIRAGDRLTVYVDQTGASKFWLGERELGRVVQPDFAQAFLAIWLDERSRDPDLTRQLRGERKQ